jgi:heme-degrading monooxygenase HmoA
MYSYISALTLLSLLFLPYLSSNAQVTADNKTVYICFEGKVFAEQESLGGQFYATLKELVKDQPGFISQTPFRSIDQDGGQVLYVRFDNDEHLHAWKNQPTHLRIQAKGRSQVFSDYRLRIGNEVTDNEPGTLDNLTVSAGKYLLLWQYPNRMANLTIWDSYSEQMTPQVDSGVWQSLVDAATYVSDTQILRISSWPSKDVAIAVRDSIPRVDGGDLRLIYVERDYGRFQRKEAPSDADRCQKAVVENDTEALKDC